MSSETFPNPRPEPIRRDGWTAARQFVFLVTLARARCVSTAARAATMSRESAYRLRRRDPDGLFAFAWDSALAPDCPPMVESHTVPLADGRLMRFLGNHYRRESGDFARARRPQAQEEGPYRT